MRGRRTRTAIAVLVAVCLLTLGVSLSVRWALVTEAATNAVSTVAAGGLEGAAMWYDHPASVAEVTALRRHCPRDMAYDPGFYSASTTSVGLRGLQTAVTVRVGVPDMRTMDPSGRRPGDVVRRYFAVRMVWNDFHWRQERVGSWDFTVPGDWRVVRIDPLGT